MAQLSLPSPNPPQAVTQNPLVAATGPHPHQQHTLFLASEAWQALAHGPLAHHSSQTLGQPGASERRQKATEAAPALCPQPVREPMTANFSTACLSKEEHVPFHCHILCRCEVSPQDSSPVGREWTQLLDKALTLGVTQSRRNQHPPTR